MINLSLAITKEDPFFCWSTRPHCIISNCRWPLRFSTTGIIWVGATL
ncbi:MAG: hypothetical protein PHP26_09620 [Syntrophomonas sp.]|nr:hypothetical protein [Syntrophomonas sp.]MDD3880228.1 hypothetical protein [Syntrophomonas sp.]